jgi:hypothetical protein
MRPYLSNLFFTENDHEIKAYLIDKMNIDFEKAKNHIFQSITLNKDKCDKWVDCKGNCEKVVRMYMKNELSSTAYFLKALAESLISIKKYNQKLMFELTIKDINSLTGNWENDSKYFNLVEPDEIGTSSRLIMGFGPSASGKTYWTKTIIDLFHRIDPSFPQSFISIDGGLYRESSYIYNITKDSAIKACYSGFSNLVVSGLSALFGKSLFESDVIKKSFIKYLQDQKSRINISMYVPDTLGDCGELSDFRIKKCPEKYKPFIEITKDKNWIGLFIYQHKYRKDCDLSENYKCFGTTESGVLREKTEGKKYSNKAWDHSYHIGGIEVMKAPGGRYIIHNSGQKNHISIIKNVSDYSNYSELEIKKIHRSFKSSEKEFNFLYQTTSDTFSFGKKGKKKKSKKTIKKSKRKSKRIHK